MCIRNVWFSIVMGFVQSTRIFLSDLFLKRHRSPVRRQIILEPEPIMEPEPPQQPFPEPPSIHQYKNERVRVSSFINWPVRHTNHLMLAQIGFYYTGHRDIVKCYFCRAEIGLWQPDDYPVEEHLRISPACPLMCGQATSNVPIDDTLPRYLPEPYATNLRKRMVAAQQPLLMASITRRPPLSYNTATTTINQVKYKDFITEDRRIKSFEDIWPKSMKQQPKDLADAGLFYTGRGDAVICFSCGIGLKNWDETDIPWEEHARWQADCVYLKLMKGQEFIDYIANKKQDEKPIVDVPVEATATTAVAVNENKLCKICFTNEYNTTFIPCGHIIACAKCASSVTACPYCRKPFTSITRVYFP